MRKHFGTDGIRGVANKKLTPELAFSLGQACGTLLKQRGLGTKVVVGRDTRRSGPMLGAALAAGFCSAGIDVVALGIAPTPAVSHAARNGGFALGIVISASHNPAPDNGIKLLGPDGGKMPDEFELAVEALMESTLEDRPVGASVGSLISDRSSIEAYEDFLVGLVPERLDGLKVAVDAAHGAAYELAPRVLNRLGAEVVVVGDSPDGMNINEEGGATKPQTVQDLTVQTGAVVGVAFDGDADRAVFSDGEGRLVNGDRTIGIWALHWQIEPRVVVGTVMSNGGFAAYIESKGMQLERAPVGDKYVAERMRATGAKIGGEQSGHIIFPHHGPTGDGLVTMLELLRVLKREGKSLTDFYNEFENWPQLLVNVEVADREAWKTSLTFNTLLQESESKLEGNGRVNVRASGTQPMVRVMVEADDLAMRDQVAEALVTTLCQEAGGSIYSKVDLTYALGD